MENRLGRSTPYIYSDIWFENVDPRPVSLRFDERPVSIFGLTRQSCDSIGPPISTSRRSSIVTRVAIRRIVIISVGREVATEIYRGVPVGSTTDGLEVLMIMCLASAGLASGEIGIGVRGAHQYAPGTVTFPIAAIQRRWAGGIGGNIDRIDRVHPVQQFIYEVLDPPDQGSLP